MTHLVTGYAGHAHIKSADEGSFNASVFGGGQYVMELGNQFEGSVIDNNTVRILDGDGLMYGRYFRIEPNTYEDLTITTGTAGKNRIDLICMTYEKNADDETERVYLQVIKGAEADGTPSVPEYTNGNILEGASLNQMPLYQVKIEGVVLSKIERLFATIPSYEKLTTSLSNANLLVNGDFKINQRGKTSYDNSKSSIVHTVDRWRINGLTVTVNADGSVTVANTTAENARNFMQVFDDHLMDEVYTASCKVKSVSGQARMFYGSFSNNLAVGVNKFTFPKASMNMFIIQLAVGASVTLEWVKLEQGSVATPFVAPLPSDELIRCGSPDDSSESGYKAGFLSESNVVDNLESDRSDLPLSARMGSELNKKLVETVIWENPNPTSSMGEKTIDIDMTPYEGKKLEVECRYAEGENSRSLQYAKVLIGKQFYFVTGHGTVTANRRFRVESNYLKFDNAYQNGSNNANALVPLKITVLPF